MNNARWGAHSFDALPHQLGRMLCSPSGEVFDLLAARNTRRYDLNTSGRGFDCRGETAIADCN
jgi:hypothetical protein